MVRLFSMAQQKANKGITRRWPIVCLAILVQLTVIVLAGLSIEEPGAPAIRLAPVPGNPGICRVVQVAPFTDVWRVGVQAGDIVQLSSRAADAHACLEPGVAIEVRTAMLEKSFVVNAPPPVNGFEVALRAALVLMFSGMGIMIFLRAGNRRVALVSAGLFYCLALVFGLQSVRGTNALWANVLLFALTLVVPGFAATAVCLFPSASSESTGQMAQDRQPYFLYVPLLAAFLLVIGGIPLLLMWPQVRLMFLLVTFAYSVICLGVVCWMVLWGVRPLNRREQPLARLVVIGLLFLLIPLVLSLHLLRSNTFARPSPVLLLSLPLAYGYALFRPQLVGTTRLFSRRVMRVVLWLLLASLFVFPGTVILSIVSLSGDERLVLETLTLLLSLWLFPLAWHKVRAIGDQIFYHDFYQYNHALRELSTALTRLQGLDQICAFVLPRLACLLNATEIALLERTMQQGQAHPDAETSSWQSYRHPVGSQGMPTDRLINLAQLASTYWQHPSNESLILEGMYLLALYSGEQLTGFLCLGPKQNLEPYSRQDESFLSTLAAQLSVLVVNSRYLAQAQANARQLAALNHRVVLAQEEERRHLALELHDEVLQQAMLVVRQLSDAGTMTEVAEVMPLVRSVEEGLRRTCLQLRPPLLDELGLEEALGVLARQIRQRRATGSHHLHIRVVCTGEVRARLSAEVELAFYRIAQEALSNALKHAGASTIVVRLRRSRGGVVSLLIADNGRGIERTQPVKERLGLVGMQERMQAIGGRWQIRSSPGRGVAILATYIQPLSCEALEARAPLLEATSTEGRRSYHAGQSGSAESAGVHYDCAGR